MNTSTIFLILFPFWIPMVIPKDSQVKLLKLPNANPVSSCHNFNSDPK